MVPVVCNGLLGEGRRMAGRKTGDEDVCRGIGEY